MITPLRSLIDRLVTRRYPSLDDRVARLAHHLAQPSACPDDARMRHHRTQDAGPALLSTVAWATTAGVSLRLLHQAHAAHVVTSSRPIEDSSARLVGRTVRRKRQPKVATVTELRSRRTA